MNNLKLQLGQRIKELRKAKNLTQEELAEKIGIGTPNISYFENGKFTPTLETMQKIANVLDVEIYELYMFKSQKSYSDIKKELLTAIDTSEITARMLFNFYKKLNN